MDRRGIMVDFRFVSEVDPFRRPPGANPETFGARRNGGLRL